MVEEIWQYYVGNQMPLMFEYVVISYCALKSHNLGELLKCFDSDSWQLATGVSALHISKPTS